MARNPHGGCHERVRKLEEVAAEIEAFGGTAAVERLPPVDREAADETTGALDQSGGDRRLR